MRKRLNINRIVEDLAKDMWGETVNKMEYLPGLTYFKCKFYEGFIIEDKNFEFNKELLKKIVPMTILEIYTYRKEQFILERTDRNEKIPEKLAKKFNSKRYDERINFYVFTDKYMNILKYYHNEIIRYIYNNKLDEKSIRYKSIQGYVNSENRQILKDMAVNTPEFVKKSDRNKAKDYLEKEMQKRIEKIDEKDKKMREEKIELVRDCIMQKIEILCA